MGVNGHPPNPELCAMELRFESPHRQAQNLSRPSDIQPLNIAEPHSLPAWSFQRLPTLHNGLQALALRVQFLGIGSLIMETVCQRIFVRIVMLVDRDYYIAAAPAQMHQSRVDNDSSEPSGKLRSPFKPAQVTISR
jgi:hypothetical protein